MRNYRKSSFRCTLHQILDPEQSQTGNADPDLEFISLWVNLCLFALILGSSAAVLYDMYLVFVGKPIPEMLFLSEVIFTALFTIEYAARCYASPNRLRYLVSGHAIIDLAAILPSVCMFAHILTLGSQTMALRLFRSLRMFRLFRIVGFRRTIGRFIRVSKTQFSAIDSQYRLGTLARLVGVAVVIWIVGSNVLYYIERIWGSARTSGATDIGYWHYYWLVNVFVVSGMDVDEPVSVPGKIVVTCLLLSGVSIIAIFTGEVTTILVKLSERRGKMMLKPPELKFTDHVVILGRNDHLENIIIELNRAFCGTRYILVVCDDAESIPSPGREAHSRVFALEGNPTRDDVLDAANVENAFGVIVLSGSTNAREKDSEKDDVALMRAIAAIARNKRIPLVVELQNPHSTIYASAIESADCIVGRKFGEMLISQSVQNGGVVDIYDNLMTFRGDTNEFYRIEVPRSLVGRTFRDAQAFFLDYDSEPIIPVGIDRNCDPPFSGFQFCIADQLGVNPFDKRILEKTDMLIVCACGQPSFARGSQHA